jgi:hypothetical protein
MTLSYETVMSVRNDFPEVFEDIFRDQRRNLYATLRLKLHAIKMLEGSLDVEENQEGFESATSEKNISIEELFVVKEEP